MVRWNRLMHALHSCQTDSILEVTSNYSGTLDEGQSWDRKQAAA